MDERGRLLGCSSSTLSHWWRLTMFNIRVALAATALTFGSAAIVSAQQQTTPQGVHQDHAQRPDSARRRMGARGLRGQLFKGITLSDAEKANLKAVQTK